MPTQEKKVIPADVFDALELSAFIYGGIGFGMLHDATGPCCLLGHIEDITDDHWPVLREVKNAVRDPVYGVAAGNDLAVYEINTRKGASHRARVSWEEYIEERGWVRGE